jgi:protein involved in polysaccharide export with SLBB domain
MGRTVSLFLTRAAGLLIAGMLLFAVFGHAHAQTNSNQTSNNQASVDQRGSQTVGNQAGDDYGLKRFPGDNYDTLPPGDGIPPPPAPQGYAPVSGSSVSANGYYSTLSTNPAQAQQPQSAPPPASSQPAPQPGAQQAYQPAPQQPMPQQQAASTSYGYKPLPPPVQAAPANQPAPANQAVQAYQPAPQHPMPQQQAASTPYGYKPLPPLTPQYPQGPVAPVHGHASYQPPANGRAPHDYVLGAGDKLRLTVFDENDLSGEFTIDGSGYARLPLIGQVRAAGYTSQQLEQVIANDLARGYLRSPRVSVEVITYRPFYIIGAVNRPGQYPYVDHMTALNAVALAGGFTSGAVESVVFVRREGSNQEVEMPADRTTQIYPGDVVKVHNTFFTDAMNLFAPFSGVAASAATAAVIQ